MQLELHVTDTLTLRDELAATVTNKQGQIAAERIQKTDLNTRATLAADFGTPAMISVDRNEQVGGFEEERAAAEALVNSYNKGRNTSYEVEPKLEEDHNYADRVFVSLNDEPCRINIQMRHLDTEIIAGVGKHGTFKGNLAATDVVASIRDAIDDKAKVDPKLKAESILQLIVPAPFGTGIKKTIEGNIFDCKGFREIWISPFHEDSFPLNRS